ncbi:MAG: ABC transporter permease [Bryobacterales bacterium]
MRWPWFSREPREQEFDEEIQAHFAMAVRDRIERGESPEAAEQAARREFGNRTRIHEITREVWRWNWLDRIWQDVRYGLRMMRRAPAFTAVAVLSLALGIGANTAIFSLINTLMLRLLPVREPEQLVELLHQFPNEPRLNADFDAYLHLRDNNQVLSGLIAASRPHSSQVSVEDSETESIDAQYISGSYFEVLGVQPAIGRLIGPADDSETADPVAVVSWSYWQSRFNLDPAIVGTQIRFRDSPVTIVGVTQPEFFGIPPPALAQIWVPLSTDVLIGGAATSHGMAMIGRLKPGVSLDQAKAELSTLYFQTFDQAKLKTDYYLSRLKFDLEPARASPTLLRDRFARPLLFVMAVVGLLLLIACTNVASMLLARGAAREREMALRVALGAGKIRLLRQMLTESLLLSTAGTLIGAGLAYFGAGALVRIIASGRMIGLPRALEIPVEPDSRVLLFTTGVALLTGVLFGLVPALRAMSAAPASSLRAAGKGVETRFGRLFGNSLVVSQVALSVLLLSAAGLFLHHLSNLRDGLGFEQNNLLLLRLDPEGSGYEAEELSNASRQLLDRLETIPGVRSAAFSGMTPISGAGWSQHVNVEGYQDKPGERRYLSLNAVSPGYFETYGTPLLAGRNFTFQDYGGPRVAVINQTMARFYFGDGNPIGKRFTIEGDEEPYDIVGVAGDAKYIDPQEPTLKTIYLPRLRGSNFTLRTDAAPAAIVGEVRRAVSDVLKGVKIDRVTTMADQVDAAMVPERLTALLSVVFGALGSLLAAIGLYGLLAYTVARRSNEIGIRMALGATRGDATRMILWDALRMVAAGLVLGIPIALWSKRFAASVMEDLPIGNPAPIALGATAMVVVALLAAYLPARRAASVDPIVALRHE